MSNKIMEFLGEKPNNPHIFEGDRWVYYLGEIVELPPYEDSDEPRWQAELIEVVPLSEYYERERTRLAVDMSLTEARCNVTAFEYALMYGGGA